MNVRSFRGFVRSRRYIVILLISLLLVAVWHLTFVALDKYEEKLARPYSAFAALVSDIASSPSEHADGNIARSFMGHLLITVVRWLLTFLLATVVGVGVGVFIGTRRTTYAVAYPMINFFRSLPSAALWPVLALIAGFNWVSQILAVVYGATWPVLLNTIAAMRSLPREVYDTLEFMQLSRRARFGILVRWASPGIMTGIEISSGVAFLLVVTVEMLFPGNGGVGWYLQHNLAEVLHPPQVFAGVVVVAFLGWGVNGLIGSIRGAVVFWERGDETPVYRGARILKVMKDRAREFKAGASRGWLDVLPHVNDERLRCVLQTEYVSDTIRDKFGAFTLQVLYNCSPPLVFPGRLNSIFDGDSNNLHQRDILICAPMDEAGSTVPLLFARSWLNAACLSGDNLNAIHRGEETIGDIIASDTRKMRIHNHEYELVLSDQLGAVFGVSGVTKAICRRRVIYLDDSPVCLIHEYVRLNIE